MAETTGMIERKETGVRHSLPMKMKLLIAAACVSTVIAVFLWKVYAPARQARIYLHEIADIVPGKTTEPELLSKSIFQNTERHCHEDECEYDFTAWNSGLSAVHLAPHSIVGVRVRVRNGVVTEVWASASLFSSNGSATTALQEVAANNACGAKPCIRRLQSPQKMAQKFVHTTVIFDGSSDLHHRMGTAINANCLYRLGGCTDPAEFAPVLKDAGDFVKVRSWPPASAETKQGLATAK